MISIFNDKNSSLEQKVELIASNYIDFITNEPDIPMFLLNEMRSNIDDLMEKIPVKPIVMDTVFYNQYMEAVNNDIITEMNPMIFLTNLLSLIVFPFMGKPLLQKIDDADDAQYEKMMQERKKMIPVWIKSMFYRP